ncbi:DNA-directed RNA polymerase subunit delta [Croceifilum oryzae]|uniref:Probable DNA-directed RNA polymerase subunit delta n=1 Tax=Croceifilum oryzae TaxID=1553429 RepID=A0AAJ1TGB2_9BACL|nr:DNA-directed RNA polymerase subunit delta [Croceifilum oryzae]MDQ0418355.1 DNA-directed RNA polymerase subunit delta [Croceifilum oryzae]
MSDNLTLEQIRETAMVDLAYIALGQNNGQPLLYRDLIEYVSKTKGFTEEDVTQYIAQFYTDLNVDGRFVCVGRSLWGLREWYPTDQATDSAIASNILDDDDFGDEIYEDESDDFAPEPIEEDPLYTVGAEDADEPDDDTADGFTEEDLDGEEDEDEDDDLDLEDEDEL